jgi:DUF1009 family protein
MAHSDPGAGADASGRNRIAVIAGGGALPSAIVRTLRLGGHDPLVATVIGEADETGYAGADCFPVSVEDLGPLLARFRREGVGRVVMAGQIERRPRLFSIRWSWRILASLPRAVVGLRRGDDALLRAVIGVMEANGIEVVAAHEIVPDLLAPEGLLTRTKPSARDLRDIEAGAQAARAIGRLDIGQAAIAIGGRAIALEGIEGTDGLLARTAQMRGHGRLAGREGGVLVKCCKPQQDRRADLPAIGPDTIDEARKAGLSGIALDAGASFILELERTVALADSQGLFILGLKPEAKP